MEKEYAAEGLKFAMAQDSSEFTLKAAEAVNHDLLLAIVLVALVMLVFLHSMRNAIIVMVAIPASLVSTYIAITCIWIYVQPDDTAGTFAGNRYPRG